MTTTRSSSALVLIGGHEDKTVDCEILSEFVSVAGGATADIVIMTTASQRPDQAGREYQKLFYDLGIARDRLHVCDGRNSDLEIAAQRVCNADGVFFVGGEPSRIIDTIKGTMLDQILHERFADRLVIGGTSAGALMMPEIVIIDGESRTHPTAETTKLGPGMGFLKQVLLDVHFAERGRCGRMISALSKHSECVGIGIDEDAAVVYRNGECEVFGSGSVFIFDPSGSDFAELTPDDQFDIAVEGVRLHVLPKGFTFRLENGSASEIKRKDVDATSSQNLD